MTIYDCSLTAAHGYERKQEADEHDQSSGENSVMSGDVTSQQPPRKRSRKGRAFKLDTLCMKLQEQRSAAYGSDEDSNMDNEEMYSSDLLPLEAESPRDDRSPRDDNTPRDEQSPRDNDTPRDDRSPRDDYDREAEMARENIDVEVSERDTDASLEMEATAQEDSSKESVDEALKEIHSSLAILNNKNAREADKRASIDSGNGDSQEEPTSSQPEETGEPEKVRLPSPSSQSRRKSVPAAIQRGADIAWKLINSQKLGDPAQIFKNGNNNHNMELSALDRKLWLNTADCMSDLPKGDYECPHCKIAFGDIVMYTMHMGYHGYKDPYKCNMCGDTCKDRVEFFLHIARAAHN